MKKPAWASMLVLDVRLLSEGALTTLAKAYDELCKKELAPIAQLDSDRVRRQFDDKLSGVLKPPKLGPIRELLAREPGLTARDIAPRKTQADLELGDEEGEDEEQTTFFPSPKRSWPAKR